MVSSLEGPTVAGGTITARSVACACDIIDMVAKGDKEVKEQLAASVEHLQLHRAAALERASAADDQRQVVCAKLRVGVGCIGVSISGRGKNGAGLDSRLQTLLPKSDTFEFIEPVLLSSTVDDGVLQYLTVDTVMVDGRFRCATGLIDELLNLPRVPLLIVDQSGVVVAFIEKLKDGGKYLGLFIGQCDPLVLGLRHVSCQHTLEEGRCT